MTPSVCIKTLGCRLNEAELENWAYRFDKEGFEISAKTDEADLIVINTCAVTQEAIKKSRQLIRKTIHKNPTAKLVVCGCYGTLNPGLAEEIDGINLVVPNQDKDMLVDIVKPIMEERKRVDSAVEASRSVLLRMGRQRAFIKIQDGCRHRCTFCIVTIARGSERSIPIRQIVEQIDRLHGEGINEVVLAGVHIGGYGCDMGESLETLIRAILSETGIQRLRLASLEPWNIPEGFLELFDNQRVMPHLHLPLQSGSDRILRRMGRRCKTSDYARFVQDARSAHKDMNITTDIIAGFPGESDCDWQKGFEFIRQVEFGDIHIFPYSPRPGTAAAMFSGRLPPGLIKSRCTELNELRKHMKQTFVEHYLGRNMPAVCERDTPINKGSESRFMVKGYTPNFIRASVMMDGYAALSNQMRLLRLKHYDTVSESVIAEIVDGRDKQAAPDSR